MAHPSNKELERLYVEQKWSAAQIAAHFECSEGKINYWLHKYHIVKRSISEATYAKRNPDGDPFERKKIENIDQALIYGMGLGLYWGEGTKANKHSVRLGNTDPGIINTFITFLETIFLINRGKLKFGLQVFNDMSSEDALKFWMRKLKVSKKQFQKVVVTPAQSIGNYRQKSKYGVLTVYFNNKKLRNAINDDIEKIKELY